MRNNDLNVHVFENRNPSMYVHYLIDNFFSNFDCNKKKGKTYGGTELFSEKTEAVHSELNFAINTPYIYKYIYIYIYLYIYIYIYIEIYIYIYIYIHILISNFNF